MYFECMCCHHIVDDGAPGLERCLDCLYIDELAERADNYYSSLCDSRGYYYYEPKSEKTSSDETWGELPF